LVQNDIPPFILVQIFGSAPAVDFSRGGFFFSPPKKGVPVPNRFPPVRGASSLIDNFTLALWNAKKVGDIFGFASGGSQHVYEKPRVKKHPDISCLTSMYPELVHLFCCT